MRSHTNIIIDENSTAERGNQNLAHSNADDYTLITNRLKLKALLMSKYYFFENLVEYNLASIAIGLTKIMLCCNIIVQANFSQDGSSDLSLAWILATIIYEIYCLFITVMRINTIYDAGGKIYDFQDPIVELNPFQDLQLQERETNVNISIHFSPHSQSDIDDLTFIEIKGRMQTCRALSIVSYFLWLGLFISGLIRSSLIWNARDLPSGDTFVLSYALVSLIGLLTCVIIFFGFKMLHYQMNKTKGISNPLKYLRIIDYNKNITGNKECIICLVDYCEGDKIALPPCTAIHHLHKECAMDWFKLSSNCPFCRQSICET